MSDNINQRAARIAREEAERLAQEAAVLQQQNAANQRNMQDALHNDAQLRSLIARFHNWALLNNIPTNFKAKQLTHPFRGWQVGYKASDEGFAGGSPTSSAAMVLVVYKSGQIYVGVHNEYRSGNRYWMSSRNPILWDISDVQEHIGAFVFKSGIAFPDS